MSKTAIEWTDRTDNIIVAVDKSGNRHGWWCRKISPGCAHCYSETTNQSDYFHGNHLKYAGAPPALKLREDIIDGWRRAKKPSERFVSSMTDVMGEWVPRSWIFRYLDGMAAAPRQTFHLLTKRADVLLRETNAWLEARGLDQLPSNIWAMVSIEDQRRADERIRLLLQVRAAVLGLSIEPLLERVCISDIFDGEGGVLKPLVGLHWQPTPVTLPIRGLSVRGPRTRSIGWVIVGGESGKGSRPMHPAWVRSLRDQCVAAGVPFFFKQWGEWMPFEDAPESSKRTPHNWLNARGEVEDVSLWMGKKVAGRRLDGRLWNEKPARVEVA